MIQTTKYNPQTKEELKQLVLDDTILLGSIDTSAITDMSYLFQNSERTDFSGIETWDTRNVTDMKGMFDSCKTFNHPINNWNVSNVTNMSFMFCKAEAFNQPLESWNVANVTDMSSMFEGAESFNQSLDLWKVKYDTIIQDMFDEGIEPPLWQKQRAQKLQKLATIAEAFQARIDSINAEKSQIQEAIERLEPHGDVELLESMLEEVNELCAINDGDFGFIFKVLLHVDYDEIDLELDAFAEPLGRIQDMLQNIEELYKNEYQNSISDFEKENLKLVTMLLQLMLQCIQALHDARQDVLQNYFSEYDTTMLCQSTKDSIAQMPSLQARLTAFLQEVNN